MRCRPSRWLWGLLPLALIGYLVYAGERPRIEKDLQDRTNRALQEAGQGWSTINFASQGRDGVIVGTAEEQSNREQAIAIARNVWGVRIVDNRTSLIELIKPYAWSAKREPGVIRLTGYVPSTEERLDIVAAAKAAFPVAKIDDQLRLGRGIDQRANWLVGAKHGIAQLALLEQGETRMDDMALSLTGVAASPQNYKAVIAAMQKLPARITLKELAIRAPNIDPFVLNAITAANKTVTLKGYVPTGKAKTALVATAQQQFRGYKVIDQTEIAGGAPEGLMQAAAATLPALARLEQGELAFSNRSVVLAGIANKQDDAEAATQAFTTAVVAPFTGVPKITYRTARENVIAPYVWSACYSNDVLTLDGYVPDEAVRASVVAYANQRFLGRTIADRMQIGAGAPEPVKAWLASVQTGMRAVSLVGGGCARQTDKRLSVDGETTIKGLPQRVDALLQQSLPQGYGAEAEIGLLALPEPEPQPVVKVEPKPVVPKVEPPKVVLVPTVETPEVVVVDPPKPAVAEDPVASPFYTTVKYDGINVTLDGVVPSDDARRQLLTFAQKAFPDRTFIDRLAVAKGAPSRWNDVMNIGLGQLAQLDAGQFTLNDSRAFLSGATDSEQTVQAARKALTSSLPSGYSGGEQLAYIAPPKPDPMILATKQQQSKYDVGELLASNKQLDGGECQAALETVARRGKALFGRGSASIDATGKVVLTQLVPIAARCPGARIRIAGHTDSDGATAFNQRLSERRATAVVDFLGTAGVDRSRLSAFGYGESQPIAENTTVDNKAQNRRIEFEVELQ